MAPSRRLYFIFESCTWQNRLYALTICGLFILFHLELRYVLQCTPQVNKTNQINPHNYKYLINQPHLCTGSRVFLAIFVTSVAKDTTKRKAIRQTWGSNSELEKHNTILAFLVGNSQRPEQQIALENEAKLHGDIIQEDFKDVYSNLTLKSIMALKWCTQSCQGVEFIMKTDSDMFVNIPYLVDFLKSNRRNKKWIIGCIKDHVSQPLRMENGILKVAASLPKLQPTFVAGAGYVISGDIIEPLFKFSQLIRYYPVEDVFITGKCASAIGVRPEHDTRFSCGEIVQQNCIMSTKFTGHKISPERQYWIWQDLKHSCNHERVSQYA